MESVEREIRYYETPEGQTPLVDWLESLDMQTQQIVETRIFRVKLGNFGDCKSVGGAKGTQTKDIKKAKEYWKEYKRS